MRRILVTWILIAAMVLSPAAVFADQIDAPENAASDTDAVLQKEPDQEKNRDSWRAKLIAFQSRGWMYTVGERLTLTQ